MQEQEDMGIGAPESRSFLFFLLRRKKNWLKVVETDVLMYPIHYKRKALPAKQMGLSAI